MKKNFRFAFVGAIALLGAVGISSCSSSSDEVINNPDYNPEKNTVKTEFVINITQPNERTRQGSDAVGNGSFQGINNMQLICLTAAPGNAAGADNAVTSNKKFPLTTYDHNPSLSSGVTSSSSQVYTLYLPVGTTNFLFYATAKASTASDYFGLGALENSLTSATKVTGGTDPDVNIKFNLKPIVSTAADVTNLQGYLTTILNGIVGAQVDASHTWAGLTSATEAHYLALRNAYNQFTHQTSAGDVRQGSSGAIMNMVKDLFNSVNDVYMNETNADAKALAKAIITKISDYFDVTITGTNPNETYSWPTTSSYKSGTDGATFNSNKYPESQNLPDGSAVITFTSGTGFQYTNTGTAAAALSPAYSNYTYPSELTYYCNSGLWQTTASKNSTDYPTTSASWLSDSWTGWDNTAVTAATRAVAMKDNITYGAAQLVSNIKLGATSFTDNASAVTGTVIPDNVFDGSTADKTITLKVHGILVGGQPDEAQYEYLPNGVGISKVIYDKFSSEGTTLSASNTTNYTLVLDNYSTSGTQSTVNIALEMTADKDFYGKEGMIRAGQKFYLIGALDPASPTSGSSINWAQHVSFKSGDTGYNVNRVFIRDAKTEANFTVGSESLKKAYSTIPDLRSTQMLFGISVDLNWKAGLAFDIAL